jgi:hypothetical protein
VRLSDPRLSHIYSRDVVRRATQARCDLVHIQYPTAGYGRSYTPAALPAAIRDRPVVVTLHEYSVFRWYRRNWFAPYARRCAARIFTTDEERQLFAQRFPRRCGVDDTIEIASNIPDDAVAKRLASAGCAYLPFPDGASGKRGTLAAALINKLIVITRHSAITPAWIAAATLHAGDPASALSQLNSLLTNRAAWDTAAQKSSAVDGRYRWDSIARRHADLYQSLLSGRRALAREPAEASLRPAGISI